MHIVISVIVLPYPVSVNGDNQADLAQKASIL